MSPEILKDGCLLRFLSVTSLPTQGSIYIYKYDGHAPHSPTLSRHLSSDLPPTAMFSETTPLAMIEGVACRLALRIRNMACIALFAFV